MKSTLRLVFDFETDPTQVGPERMRKVGLLGIALGGPAAVIGVAVSLVLLGQTHTVSRLTIAPGVLGLILLANGSYRLIIGFVPVIGRVAVLRMGLMLFLLCLMAGGLLTFVVE